MAIGRISGSVLKSNLTRNGTDLAFETNLLYLDVTNSRVGIGTASPTTALDVSGALTTSGVINANGTGNSILVSDTLRIAENGSGLRMTNIGAFDNNNGSFRVFSNNDLIFSAGGSDNTALTVDGTTRDITINNDLTIGGLAGVVNEMVIVGDSNGQLTSTDLIALDTGNNRVGIGTTSPATKFHIAGEGANEGQIRLQQAHDGSDGPDFAFYASRGTIAAPTSTANNDTQGRINAYVHNGTNFVQSGSFGWSSDGTDGDNRFDIRSRVGGTLAARIEITAAGDIEFQDGAFDVDVKSHDGTNGLKLGGTLVTSSATELNLLDGVTGLTLGDANEILIVGTGGTAITSTSVLSIDDGNNYIGINQTSPQVTLHMTGEAAQSAQIRMEQMADTADAPDIRTRKSRGTAAAPTKNNAGDFIYRQNHERYNGTGWTTVGQLAVDTDDTNADRFVMTFTVSEDGNSIDAAQNQLQIDGADSGAITFNQAYKFPTADGSANEVLRTDGSGTLSFGEPNREMVNSLTNGATIDIDATNGGMQFVTVSQNTTYTFNANWQSGHRVTLMIAQSTAYTHTWPTMKWAGGVAPTFGTNGDYNTVEIWRLGTTYYGAYVGNHS